MARYAAFGLLLVGIGIVVYPSGEPGLDGARLPTARVEGMELVKTISEGQRVEVGNHLRPRIWTLIEFTAPW